MCSLNWPSTFLQQSYWHCDHPWPSHCTFCGCTRLISWGQAGGKRWRQVTNLCAGRSSRERQGEGSSEGSNASVTLNASWQVSAASPEAISCIWHMHFCEASDWLWLPNDISCLSNTPLRIHKCTWHWVHWSLTPHVDSRIQQGTQLWP